MLGPLLYSVYVNKTRVYLKDTYIANSICKIRRWFNSKSSYYSQKIRDVYKFKFAVCECKEKFLLTFCRVGDSVDISSKGSIRWKAAVPRLPYWFKSIVEAS